MRFIYTKTFRRMFAAFVLLALFVIADARGYTGRAKSAMHAAFGEASRAAGSVAEKTGEFFKVIGMLGALAGENARLSQRLDELSFENARLQSAKAENLALRRALNFLEERRYATVPAEVLTMDPTGFSQMVVIDKGEADGVAVGQAVVTAPGLLAGRVTKTYRTSSEVTLVTDPTITVNAEIAESGAKGLVRGEHGLALVLDLVTQNEVIKTGDRLLTSGLAGDFPPGLLVGEISAIKSSSSDLFQQAYVSPLSDLKNLKFVLVIK